jgi:hypothetical protein
VDDSFFKLNGQFSREALVESFDVLSQDGFSGRLEFHTNFSLKKMTHNHWPQELEHEALLRSRLPVLIQGETGSGKSHFTGTMCFKHAMKEPNFITNDGTNMFIPKENFIIDPEEFAYKMITKEGQVLWGDEFRRGSNRRSWYSPINKAIVDRKNTNRKLFNIYFLCLPFEKEFDPALGGHLTLWIWIRRGVGEVYCKRSGVKGGTGLNIQSILEREEKYLKENPRKTMVNPTIHPEYVGRIAFNKLTAGLDRQYQELVKEKKATGDLSDEEKAKYGIVVEKDAKQIIIESIAKIKSGKIRDKKGLWTELDKVELDDDKKIKLLNFYLKLEGWDSFNKLFDVKKVEQEDIW